MIVTAVEYLNTLPMVSGIRSCKTAQAGNLELLLCNPAQCAQKALEKSTDIALVPVGALFEIADYQIVTDYCISATGVVDTVCLLSNTPLPQITRIYLDTESRTSVQLCRILCRELWKITPEFFDGISNINSLQEGEAIVAIGDKVFEIGDQFTHKTDLSAQWHKLTGLPFVFAVWIALTPTAIEHENALNQAIKYGIENIEKWLPDGPDKVRNLDYLTQKIEYEITPQKRTAIDLFLSKINPPKIEPHTPK